MPPHLKGEVGILAVGRRKPLVKAADLKGGFSGRRMEVWTTMPGIQLYTGNHFDRFPGKGGMRYNKYAGVALETQHAPDAVHHPEFESTLLRAGEIFESHTVYSFSVR